MVASWFTVYPQIVTIYLHAGWVMGGVNNRYLKYISAGYQYVGICKNYADQNYTKFDFSPPHFYFSSFELNDRIERKKKLDKFLSDRFYQLTDNADDKHIKYLAEILYAYLCHHH